MDSNKRLWIYTGLALVAGVGLVSAVAPSAPVSTPRPSGGPPPLRLGPGARVLLIGDSLAQGLKLPLQQLAGDAKVPFAADGRQGSRIDQWNAEPWLQTIVTAFRPTLVLVSLGTNDMRMAAPAETQKAPLAALVAKLRAAAPEVGWIMPPTMPFPDRGMRALLLSTGLPVFRSDQLTIQRAGDGIHPTAMGYGGWAGQVWRWAAGAPRAPLSGLPTRRNASHARVAQPMRSGSMPGGHHRRSR